MGLVYRPTHPLANSNGMVPRECVERDVAASDLPFPCVISDQIEIKSMADGQMYTSKSGLRKSYRQLGYIEVGNEEQKPKAPHKPDRKAIRDSVGRAMNRVGISL